jgi:hypothetical protein
LVIFERSIGKSKIAGAMACSAKILPHSLKGWWAMMSVDGHSW